MNRKYLIAAAMTAVMMIGAAEAKPAKKVRKNKREDVELLQKIDSLQAIIDSMRMDEAEYLENEASDTISYEAAALEEEKREFEFDFGTVELDADATDSLLSIWVLHKKVGDKTGIEEYDMDSVRFKSNVPDSVYLERIAKMNSYIQIPYNDIVRNYIIMYSEKMPTKMGEIMGLCNYYMPIFQEVFDRYDMPEELSVMAVIESCLNPTAVSRAGAKGAWQFMYSTAKLYGLEINSFVDERLDPVKAADAAARYLKDAYRIFGDWNLAISSYNCGAGNVNKAIRRSGGKRDFWSIYPYLPRETRGYVPAFVGALYAMTYYKEHGITPRPATLPIHVDTIHVNKMLHFAQINELVGIPIQELKDLNPQYKHQIIPGKDREYILTIPYNYVGKFIDNEDSLYTYKADSLFNPVTIKKIKDGGDGERIVYRVKSGDYLGKIARKYRVSVAQIKRWNGLRSNNLRIGQRLVIYRGGHAPSSSSSTTKATTAKASTQKSSSSSTVKSSSSSNIKQQAKGYTWYTVKDGESLYLIAKKYPGVSAQNIMDYNGIGSNIKPGTRIKIPTL